MQAVMQDEIIVGIAAVTRYLQLSRRTTNRILAESDKYGFPEPWKVESDGRQAIKIWLKKDLDAFKATLRPAFRVARQR